MESSAEDVKHEQNEKDYCITEALHADKKERFVVLRRDLAGG